jgi:hypothetical protein
MATIGKKMTTQKEIISRLIRASEAQFGNSSGTGWMGQSSGIQQQVASEIATWTETHDDAILHSIVALLETVSGLSSAEAAEIHEQLNAINS